MANESQMITGINDGLVHAYIEASGFNVLTRHSLGLNDNSSPPSAAYRGYPAKRALSAMCKHGG